MKARAYIRTKESRDLYLNARSSVNSYIQFRIDELMAKFDLNFDEALNQANDEIVTMAGSIKDDILFG